MEKISLKQRDLVLVPFPFSDRSGQKVRPAVVVSNDRYNKKGSDIILCAVTTNCTPSVYSLLINSKDLSSGILYEPSAIKTDSVLKLQQDMVLKVIGAINIQTHAKLRTIISQLFGD